MILLLAVVTAILLILTLLPLSQSPRWWVRVWEFPRVQLACLALVLLISHLAVLRSGSLAIAISAFIAGGCLLYQLWWIYPYSRLKKFEVPDAQLNQSTPALSLIAANVLMENRDAGRFLQLVRDRQPDLLVTLESDHWWQQQLDTLGALYPHAVKCPLDNLYGMHLYSRLPLRDTHISYLVQEDIPSIHCEILLSEGVSIRAHFLHPTPPVPEENPVSSDRDAELIMVAKSLQDNCCPTLVAGDLNDVAWSPTTRLFRKISGLLDPRVGRGQFNTFHARYWFARWPLDHLFISDHFQLVTIRRLPRFGSDHFAIFAELALTSPSNDANKGLQPTAGDEQEADSKIAERGVSAADVPAVAE